MREHLGIFVEDVEKEVNSMKQRENMTPEDIAA